MVALTRERVGETARLLATALHDDPAYAFVFPSGSKPAALEGFFRRHLGNHVPHRCSFARLDAAGAVAGTVTLRPPGGVPVSTFTLLRGFVPFALKHSLGVLQRLTHLGKHYEELERQAAKSRRYWHVHMMAVRPDLQGRGVGGPLLDDVLSTTDGSADPLVLTTHKEINVRFYERGGFYVASEETVRLPGVEPYLVWCMRRDPGSER